MIMVVAGRPHHGGHVEHFKTVIKILIIIGACSTSRKIHAFLPLDPPIKWHWIAPLRQFSRITDRAIASPIAAIMSKRAAPTGKPKRNQQNPDAHVACNPKLADPVELTIMGSLVPEIICEDEQFFILQKVEGEEKPQKVELSAHQLAEWACVAVDTARTTVKADDCLWSVSSYINKQLQQDLPELPAGRTAEEVWGPTVPELRHENVGKGKPISNASYNLRAHILRVIVALLPKIQDMVYIDKVIEHLKLEKEKEKCRDEARLSSDAHGTQTLAKVDEVARARMYAKRERNHGSDTASQSSASGTPKKACRIKAHHLPLEVEAKMVAGPSDPKP